MINANQPARPLSKTPAVAALMSETERCPECGIRPPGHKIMCKTGNDRARRYQQGIARKYRNRKKGATKFPVAALPDKEEEREKKNLGIPGAV